MFVLLTGCNSEGLPATISPEEIRQHAQETLDALDETAPTFKPDAPFLIQPLATITEPVIVRQTPTSAPSVPTVPSIPAAPAYNEYPTPQRVRVECNQMHFVDDVTIPDGTVFKGGTTFRKTWRIQNTGTCSWDRNYGLYFTGGDRMGQAVAVMLEKNVYPGESIDVSVDLMAPFDNGTYQSNWMMRSGSGEFFGTQDSSNRAIWTNIIVDNVNGSAERQGFGACRLRSIDPMPGTGFARGDDFDLRLTVENISSQWWYADDIDLAIIDGDNFLDNASAERFDIHDNVAPGETFTKILDARAPQERGTYTMTIGIVKGYEVLCSFDETITVH